MMFKIILSTFLMIFSIKSTAQTDNPQFDKVFADSLGADEYGMKMYVLVILKTGSNKLDDKPKVDSLFNGHMKNMGRMVELGQLVIAGPIKKNEKEYRGIFILNVKTIEEAKVILETDPAVANKLLDAELYQWYGSAALPIYLKSVDKVRKKSF